MTAEELDDELLGNQEAYLPTHEDVNFNFEQSNHSIINIDSKHDEFNNNSSQSE